MKNIFSKITGVFLVALVLGIVGCEKDDLPKLDAEMVTWKKDGITSTSAIVSGFVVAEGDGYTEYGVVWGLSENPTTADSKKAADKIEKAVYWVTIDGLEYLTTYHYRAYVIDNAGNTTYGKDATFTTLANVPLLTVSDATGITNIFAQVAANVTNDGKDEVITRGVCWNTTSGPTVENDTTNNGEGIGEFTANLKNLLPATMYYARAYAINKIGIGYSNEITFTTANGVPVLSTDSVGSITKTSARAYGKVVVNGGTDLLERGFVMATTDNPTVDDTKMVDPLNTVDTMSVDITGLSTGKKYYVRTFATNADGTAYGETVEFTTESDITTWYVPGGYVAASYPGTEWQNWSPANSPFIMNTDANPTNLEGYVYMAGANNDWKFTANPDWVDGFNYGDSGTPGVLSNDPGAGNFNVPAGYYKINVDMSATPMTYTAVATQWGVIGDATPLEWSDETPLTYDPASQTWRGTVHFTAKEFKFRANHSWDYNYGKKPEETYLSAGGDNIKVDVEADYDITLDLSNPNAYTYTANRWGVIGDATPGKWGEDTNMTWDDTKKVFTVTLDLTVGQFKFRANDAWDVDFGGDLGALEQGGSNIDISDAGNYTITLDTMGKAGTLTKN
ncbi:protein of unknown function [Saccharicrinis carchari]|uniref:Fibronectin type-III domain-containing protein n=1 Tax=Saccharicrinis carchari TaxID=1168039 RepID=A0A521D6I1_SACCC|nr:SusF/SusE family outer membrane protein [Saccharicrinis carchari]SMO67284.1 protein of unknown function [Saccharicrinis carchari]